MRHSCRYFWTIQENIVRYTIVRAHHDNPIAYHLCFVNHLFCNSLQANWNSWVDVTLITGRFWLSVNLELSDISISPSFSLHQLLLFIIRYCSWRIHPVFLLLHPLKCSSYLHCPIIHFGIREFSYSPGHSAQHSYLKTWFRILSFLVLLRIFLKYFLQDIALL